MRAALSALTALLVLAGAATPSRAEEVIERFDSVTEVLPDGDLEVTETILVQAEGAQIRRGIYRAFPLRFRDAEGVRREVSFELLELTRDGHPEPHFTRRTDRGLRIYAGSEDVLLQPGRYSYELRYRTGRQLRHFPDHVELYWNVTGNEWNFPILEGSAIIRLPDHAMPVRWTAYTGRFGERGGHYRATLQPDGVLRFVTTRTLEQGEGLTVAVELPPGVVAAPSQAQQFRYTLLDHRRYVLGGLGLLGVLGFYLLAWRAVGRDPPKGIVIPQFHPPEGISPALAAYIRNWGWSGGWREFTAAAFSLAVKGLVVLEDRDGTLTLKRVDPPGTNFATEAARLRSAAPGAATLPAGERTLLDWIAGRGGVARIERASGDSLVSALAGFKSAIDKESRNRFFRRNLGYFVVGLLLTGVAVAATFKFGYIDDDEVGLLIITLMAGFFVGSLLVGAGRALFIERRPGAIFPVVAPVVAILFIAWQFARIGVDFTPLLPDLYHTGLDTLREKGFPLALVGGFALLNGLFYYLLRAPTPAGRPVMDHIAGLELYLRTAETERLNMARAPALDAERFERLLPYAIAFDAEKPWSEAFDAAFRRAHPGEDPRDSYRPDWHGGTRWSGKSLASSVSGVVGAAQDSFASATPEPSHSSSGFGGGGGAGGGGGGGGGGGW